MGSSRGRVKPKTIKLVFVASPLSTHTLYVICKTSGNISKRLSGVIPLVLQNLEENGDIESSIGKDINFPTVVKKSRNDVDVRVCGFFRCSN